MKTKAKTMKHLQHSLESLCALTLVIVLCGGASAQVQQMPKGEVIAEKEKSAAEAGMVKKWKDKAVNKTTAERPMVEEAKDKFIERLTACIDNLKAKIIRGERSTKMEVFFTTLQHLEADVTLEKWGSPGWVRVSNADATELIEPSSGIPIRRNHGFVMSLNYNDRMIAGNRYRLGITLAAYRGGSNLRPEFVRSFYCEREFTAGP